MSLITRGSKTKKTGSQLLSNFTLSWSGHEVAIRTGTFMSEVIVQVKMQTASDPKGIW